MKRSWSKNATFVSKSTHQRPRYFERLLLAIGAAAVVFSSCAKRMPLPPAVPPAFPTKPALPKTFGQIKLGGISTMLLEYKDIRILIDPVFSSERSAIGTYEQRLVAKQKPETNGNVVTRLDPSTIRPTELPPIDYLVLTDLQPHHLDIQTVAAFPKDLKTISPPEGPRVLKPQGLSNIKVVSTGQRMLLKKENAFLFLSAVQGRNAASNMHVNSYLLEFDNGQNVFISGEQVDMAVLREFVYGLRDDGKEIALALIYGGGIRTVDGKLQSYDEPAAAELISLLQPKLAAVVQAQSLNVTSLNQNDFRTFLKEQIFDGGVRILSAGDTIVF